MRSPLMRFSISSALSIMLAAAAAPADELAVYVSPSGNDAWSGTTAEATADRSDGPLATLQKARDMVRTLRSRPGNDATAIHVYLHGGAYFLDQPLVLAPEDSGTERGPIVWSEYHDQRPVISGGQPLTGWTKTTVNGCEAWTARLPEGVAGFHELWLDGRRLGRARWPHQGTLAVAGLSDTEKHDSPYRGTDQFRFAADDLKAWPTAADGEVIAANRWTESHLPVAAIDEKEHVIRFGKRTVFLPDAGDPYWVENVRECLTEPGEFYVDPRAKTVCLIPPADVDPNRTQIIVPRLAQVLRLEGDPAAGKFIEHLTFRGLGFANTEWFFDRPLVAQTSGDAADRRNPKPDPTRSGFSQAAIGVPGAVWGIGVRHCVFERCDVSHLATYGIELAQGCQKNRIAHCTLGDLGAGGVKIGETVIREPENEQAFGNEISDCTIADGGNLFPSCVALWIGQSHDNTIAHNDIHGFWYTAISVGWTWGYGKSAAQRNLIEYNHVHHLGMKTDDQKPILSDMGCVYTLGDQEGTVVRFNRFHDVAALRYGGWGIYFDEGTTRILAENNLVYRTTHGGFHQHYGKENVFHNNILAFGRDHQIQRTRIETHPSFRFEGNIVLWDQGPVLGGGWQKPSAFFDDNTYWPTGKAELRFANRTWEQWRQAGMDEHSKIADPCFVDPAHGDFAFTAQSPAAFVGFKPFDLTTVGPR